MLKSGDIVTDLEDNSCLHGKQGLVTRIQLRLWGEPEVIVRFDKEDYPYYIREGEYENGIEEVYPLNSLRQESDWRPEVYARRLFGSYWHSLYVMKEPLNPRNLCLVEGCASNQQMTIWFNIWGTVCNAHVCAEHAPQYHGLRGEIFPWRKKAPVPT